MLKALVQELLDQIATLKVQIHRLVNVLKIRMELILIAAILLMLKEQVLMLLV